MMKKPILSKKHTYSNYSNNTQFSSTLGGSNQINNLKNERESKEKEKINDFSNTSAGYGFYSEHEDNKSPNIYNSPTSRVNKNSSSILEIEKSSKNINSISSNTGNLINSNNLNPNGNGSEKEKVKEKENNQLEYRGYIIAKRISQQSKSELKLYFSKTN